MKTVLVVDDSSFQRKKICTALESNGYQVQAASNGQECLTMLESAPPDCIVLDLLMPEMGGIEVLEIMRERNLHIPVIVHTADIQDTTRQHCLDLGAVAFINKPFRADELLTALAGLPGTKGEKE